MQKRMHTCTYFMCFGKRMKIYSVIMQELNQTTQLSMECSLHPQVKSLRYIRMTFRSCQGAIAGKGPSGMAAAKRRQSQQNSELDQDKFQLPIIILGSAENNTIPIIGAN
ncbi:uncharacterized protein LOC119654999 [Hermetia illucens]|uniref:uncharacterized protein LOC119654999 n=1 Tax=Hermetia illucens TaxID=343691 RepID=UPI0018CC045D|nr:uncharacterized protein LOC119654999 [Hermetia illucens]